MLTGIDWDVGAGRGWIESQEIPDIRQHCNHANVALRGCVRMLVGVDPEALSSGHFLVGDRSRLHPNVILGLL